MTFIKNQDGLTLIETVLVIGLLVIILPAITIITVRLSREAAYFNLAQRLDTALALTVDELSSEFTTATAIDVGASTWGVNPSAIFFTDDGGQVVEISCLDDTVTLPGGEQTIKRLRWRRGTTETWLTDADIEVTNWLASIVRDSSGRLSGLRLQIELSQANKSAVPLGNAAAAIDFTFVIPPSVSEL